MKEKISTAEHAETAELFFCKDKKYKSFDGYGILITFRFFGNRDKRMNEEEAENAERTNWDTGTLELWV
jgi:hypothetical protein